MTSLCLLSDSLSGSMLIGRVVLGSKRNHQASTQAGDDGEGWLPPDVVLSDFRISQEQPEQDTCANSYEKRCKPDSHVKSLEQLAEGSTFLGSDNEDPQQ